MKRLLLTKLFGVAIVLSLAAAPALGGPPARVHANSLSSNRPQTQYGIFRVDSTGLSKTTMWKTGISSAPNRSGESISQPRSVLAPGRDYSNRALTQLRSLNNNVSLTENGRYVFRTRNFATVEPQPPGANPARAVIVAREQQTVTSFADKYKYSPPGNILPKPLPFSAVPKK